MAPTTRKRIQELASGFRQPMVRDDHLIASMVAGIDFVMGNPPFNEENLFKLYSLLSHDGLDPDCQLKKGRKYRDGQVGLVNYPGCTTDSIVPCMDSLFAFAGEVLGGQDAELRFFATYRPLLPRLWPTLFCLLRKIGPNDIVLAKPVRPNQHDSDLSEAISQTNDRNYSALRDTRPPTMIWPIFRFIFSRPRALTAMLMGMSKPSTSG